MSNAMSKHDKKQAVIFGIIFALLVIIIAYLYPLFDYLLPWNKQTIRGSIPYTALSLEEAIGQSETIVSGKVVKIEPNQYDEYNDVAYALISFEVDKVLH
ncbi:MAG TPA: hypothetical protein PLZ84_06055, partial [Clostridia bacterium]|nr:hypothetical protein [Clostridia bacterium]